ncbi:MAG: putative transport system permease protein [Chloroflexota bacterium]|jgi:putative ABC transport system permease protein|nr:putative transport system permease protein [Chloroflexota bacterium]
MNTLASPFPLRATPIQRLPSAPAPAIDVDSFALLAEPPPTGSRHLRFFESIPSALTALRANKGRSVLTTLGIIIGVAAVIAIVALGEGATASVASQLQGLGVNVLTITPGSTRSGGASSGAGSSVTLKAADADAIAAGGTGVTAVSPVVSGSAQVIAGSANWSTRISAVTPDYQTIQDWHVASGAFFTSQDNTAANNVAVIGQTVATNLFPNGQSPIGQLIQVRNVPFTVVGVLASKGSGIGGDQDDTVLIPFRTGQVRLFGSTSINQIVVQVADTSQIATASAKITQVLRQDHNLATGKADDFSIRNNSDIISRVSGVSQTMTLLLGGVAAVSLVVGGIGIMNIMLVSVTERTREIGIRLAIGAQPGDVLSQFLVEAVVLSLLGGILGIALGSGVALLMPVVAGFATVLPWNAIGLSFGVSAAIGVFFGIYPARKASRLDPIVALRYE